MANYYTSSNLLRIKRKGSDVWQGVLKYNADNPDYVEDTRAEGQRRKYIGRRLNTEYVEDGRTPNQRSKHIVKSVRKVLDARNKTEAKKALEAWHAQMEIEHAAPDAGLSTYEYVGRYIEARRRRSMGKSKSLEASTLDNYERTRRYFKQGGAYAIAAIPLRDLTPRQVEAWETELLASGLSGTTVLRAHRLLKQVCKQAVETDELEKSPVRGFEAPARSTGRPNALDATGNAKAMLALNSAEPGPMIVAAQIALYLGMRRGEICALTWGNVDLEGVAWPDADRKQWGIKKLRVAQAFGESAEGAYLKQPKTKAGARILTLEGGIVEILEKRRAAMWQEWSAAMAQANIMPAEALFNELYVVGSCDGTPCNPGALTKEWAAFARKEKLIGTEGRVVTLHDLRHSNATNAITHGADPASVAANLGHAQVSTTLNMYVSRDAAAQREANRLVAQTLDAARMGEVLPFTPRATGTDN